MLELEHQEFDQDLHGGWRNLAYKGCTLEAAELIREWRYRKRSHDSILYWHEGQLRAEAGQTEQAIDLFKLTYRQSDLDAGFGWNHYVDGTIAFLSDDRARLDRAVERLKAMPKPPEFEKEITFADGRKAKLDWPPNLKVLEGFQRCWGKSYKEAYGGECTAPIKRITPSTEK